MGCKASKAVLEEEPTVGDHEQQQQQQQQQQIDGDHDGNVHRRNNRSSLRSSLLNNQRRLPAFARSRTNNNSSSRKRRQRREQRRRTELYVKVVLIGDRAHTISRQLRLEWGPEFTDEELRMYGVLARSNIVNDTRRLCSHLKSSGLHELLLDHDRIGDKKAMQDAVDKISPAIWTRIGNGGVTFEQFVECKEKDNKEQNDPGKPEGKISPKEAYSDLLSLLWDYEEEEEDDDDARIVEKSCVSDVSKLNPSHDWVGDCRRLRSCTNHDAKLFLKCWRSVQALCTSRLVKLLYFGRKAVFRECDVFRHKPYIKDLPRIASPTYRPSSQDILIASMEEPAKPHVKKEIVYIRGIGMEINTAHGFKPKGPRWARYLNNIDAIAFVAPLSDYYTPGISDAEKGVTESIASFQSFCSDRLSAERTSFLLFLSNPDRFLGRLIRHAREINVHSVNNPDLLPLVARFRNSAYHDDFNDSFVHVKSSTGVSIPTFVLDSIRTIIMTENLRRSGFLGAPPPPPPSLLEPAPRHPHINSSIDIDYATVDTSTSSVTCQGF